MKYYNENRKKKDPNVWKKKWNSDREEIIDKLNGKCIVDNCVVTNKNWLHIDYIPTMIGTGCRHPRHRRWVLDHSGTKGDQKKFIGNSVVPYVVTAWTSALIREYEKYPLLQTG